MLAEKLRAATSAPSFNIQNMVTAPRYLFNTNYWFPLSTLNTGGISTSPQGVFLNSDGTKLFCVFASISTVYRWTLSTAFNLATATQDQTFSVASQTTNPRGIVFSPDGTKMFVGETNALNQYTLTTAWDLTTASYNTSQAITDSPYSLFFNSTGTSLFIAYLSTTIRRYDLGAAYNISGSLTLHSTGTLTTGDESIGFNFDNAGTKLISRDSGSQKYQYSLSTAYDLSTLSYVSTYSPSSGGLTITTASNNVFDFAFIGWDTTSTLRLWSDTVRRLTTGALPNLRDVKFKTDGTVFYAIHITNKVIYAYTLSTPYDITTAGTPTTKTLVGMSALLPNALCWKPDGTRIYVMGGGTNEGFYQYDLTTAWDISTISSSPVFVALSTKIGLEISSDGTKIFTCKNGGSPFECYAYTMSTPWDISTVNTTPSATLSLNTRGYYLAFTTNGKTLIVSGDGFLAQYKLTAAYDLSTASLVYEYSNVGGIFTNFSTVYGDGGVCINGDSTELTIGGRGYITQYTL